MAFHERIQIPADRLLAIEEQFTTMAGLESPILQFYRAWQDGKQDFTDIIDTSSSDPFLYRIPNHNGRLSHLWPSRVLRDFPATDHLSMCAGEYQDCLTSGELVAVYIKHAFAGEDREYFRLIAPLRNGFLAYAIRAMSGPNALTPS